MSILPRFRILLESARKTAQWFLNRPGIADLRNADEKYYMVGRAGLWQADVKIHQKMD